MREVGAVQARKTRGALLDAVQQGVEVVVTRHGKPVARLLPERQDGDTRARARRAAETIARLSQGLKLGDHSIKSLIEEGRP